MKLMKSNLKNHNLKKNNTIINKINKKLKKVKTLKKKRKKKKKSLIHMIKLKKEKIFKNSWTL